MARPTRPGHQDEATDIACAAMWSKNRTEIQNISLQVKITRHGSTAMNEFLLPNCEGARAFWCWCDCVDAFFVRVIDTLATAWSTSSNFAREDDPIVRPPWTRLAADSEYDVKRGHFPSMSGQMWSCAARWTTEGYAGFPRSWPWATSFLRSEMARVAWNGFMQLNWTQSGTMNSITLRRCRVVLYGSDPCDGRRVSCGTEVRAVQARVTLQFVDHTDREKIWLPARTCSWAPGCCSGPNEERHGWVLRWLLNGARGRKRGWAAPTTAAGYRAADWKATQCFRASANEDSTSCRTTNLRRWEAWRVPASGSWSSAQAWRGRRINEHVEGHRPVLSCTKLKTAEDPPGGTPAAGDADTLWCWG